MGVSPVHLFGQKARARRPCHPLFNQPKSVFTTEGIETISRFVASMQTKRISVLSVVQFFILCAPAFNFYGFRSKIKSPSVVRSCS